MTKGYVVLEIGWEYNDETYSRHEDGGGIPIVVYKDLATAVSSAEKLNVQKRKENEGWPMVDGDEKPITDFYEVVTVEMED